MNLYLCINKIKREEYVAELCYRTGSNVVTIKMSRSRWNRLQKLEESYKVAASIRKGLKQIEKSFGYVGRRSHR